MYANLVTDELWSEIEPLLPKVVKHTKAGAPRCDDRACLEGILYVLRGGIAWRLMPMQYPSPTTCWRRFRQWTASGVWARLLAVLLQHLEDLGQIDWSRAVIDTASVRAVFGGSIPDPTPSTGRKLAANAV
jgi:transposase